MVNDIRTKQIAAFNSSVENPVSRIEYLNVVAKQGNGEQRAVHHASTMKLPSLS